MVGPAGLELSQAARLQVWVKVWGSYSKTFPDVPDFAQRTIFGSPQNNAKNSGETPYCYG